MKASELILLLKNLIALHGDQEVFAGGEDYPALVHSATIHNKDDGYVEKGAIKLRTRNF